MLLLALALLADPVPPPPETYVGRLNQIRIAAPRIEADATIDGALDDAAWQRAALLTGFSQYAPVDGRAAEDSTEVLVWYAPTAIYFGIRAYESHGSVRATLADRDRIGGDDFLQLYLDTFADRRQATVFGVNPLGVQSDGTFNEAALGRTLGSAMTGGVSESVNLSADFVYQSRGRVTPWGYEVEIRIPFKSIRFSPAREQRWGFNVVRQVQHSGYQDSWAPVRRDAASFLEQSGTVGGLTELRRGLVVDLNPEVTQRQTGRPEATGPGWDYADPTRRVGGSARWGVTTNLTLNGAIRPDFSQVESDVSQVQYDPRNALFYPDKRPFFLDGIEQFDVPNRLIYTRSIVEPVGAAKLSGKLSGTNVGFISAVDDTTGSVTQRHRPLANILRVRRDLGGASTAGLVYTDRRDGTSYNRVAGADARVVFGKIYTLRMQGAASVTRDSGERAAGAPLWDLALDRSGRRLSARYQVNGIHDAFEARSGFLTRTGIATATADHRLTFYGAKDALVQSWTTGFMLNDTWKYGNFVRGRSVQDAKYHINNTLALRGGWRVGAAVFIESFGFDEELYGSYAIERTSASGVVDTVPFTGTPRLDNLDLSLTLTTPQLRRFFGTINVVGGVDENFAEWSSATIWIVSSTMDWRPTDKLRVNGRYTHQHYIRRSDGTTVGLTRIPRVKVEYQVARPVFVRLVGEYAARYQDRLRDDSRTEMPILRYSRGQYRLVPESRSNVLRTDLLFAYQPSPGTVLFVGYGSSLTEPAAFTVRALERTQDAVFVKLSYVFRL